MLEYILLHHLKGKHLQTFANGLIALSHIVFKTFIELYLLQQPRMIQYKNQAEYDEK